MSKELLWKLFSKTGNITYYNLLKKISEDVENEIYKNSYNNSNYNNTCCVDIKKK